MDVHHLQLPLSEERARNLELGTTVTVSGLVFTGRSLFHIRAVEQHVLPSIDFKQVNCFFMLDRLSGAKRIVPAGTGRPP